MDGKILFKVSSTRDLSRWKSYYIGIKHFLFNDKLYTSIGIDYVRQTHSTRRDLPITTIMQKLWNDRKPYDRKPFDFL